MRWMTRSLHRKLSILLIACIIIPVLLLGYVSYRTAWSISEEKSKQASLNTLRQISAILETIAQDVENMSIFLIGQHDVQQYLAKDRASANDYLRMVGFLTNLAFSKSYIADIRIIPLNGNPELSNTTVLSSHLFGQAPSDEAYWEEHPVWWSPPTLSDTTLGQKRTVSLVRPIRNMNNFDKLGMLSIGIDGDALAERLREAAVDGGGSLFLLDADGNIVAANADRDAAEQWPVKLRSLAGQEAPAGAARFSEMGEGRDRHIVVSMSVPIAPWSVYALIPYQTFSAQNSYLLQFTAVTVAIVIAVIAAVAAYVVKRVTKPIIRLARSIGAVQPERPFRPLPQTSSDEIGMLVHSYNQLSDNIRNLTEQVKENEARKKEADLLALQAQIHPHFLYNTLSSVQWMAYMEGNGRIASLVGALGDFLRFSLNRGLETCSLEQETEHVANYLEIQSVRYPGRFDYRIHLPEELKECTMLKLLLQPLVENAITHGLLPAYPASGGRLLIEIVMIDSGRVRFTVQDNGGGLGPEELERVRERLSAPEPAAANAEASRSGGSGYGLFNVQRRLLLHYGSGAELRIESQPGEGTAVSFSIPVDRSAR
ncbi:histidine kinase [Paenibacillus thiaminolyticus]|uniref:cache domain-containing sensor histidine kinase n=1 Tax=Paenibacillus thiaminolyticus TaxID=49283 RepID=UPI003D27899A